MKKSSPTLQWIRTSLSVPCTVLLLNCFSAWSVQTQGADFYWDVDANDVGNNIDGTNLGGAGTWDTSALNWWDAAGSSMVAWPNDPTSNALFSYAFPTSPYAVPLNHAVTVDAGGVTVNRLSFLRSGYTLAGGAITLAGDAPGAFVALGDSATVSSQISGSAGFSKSGGGTLRLTNNANNYTGITTIANGTLMISDPAALGGTGTVSIVTNNNTPLNTNLIGFGGGSLVLDGTAAGFTFARDVDFEGQGPIGGRGSAILSLGNNTLSGTLTSAISPLPLSPTATIRSSRINSVNGMLTLSGTLNVGGTAGTTVTSLGGINSAGAGDFSLTGVLAGTGTLEKSGAGTLFLTPSDTAGFSGRLRVSGSRTGQQSSVRVTQATVGGTSIFGAGTGTTTASAIDLNGAGLAVLEFRNDGDLNFGALASGKNVYNRNRGIIFTGPAAGGAGINGTTTLGALHQNASTSTTTNSTTFESRNGFGVTFTTLASDASTSTSTITNTLTNNMGGTLRFTGNVTRPEGSTASRPRPLVIGGNGNTYIQGSIISGTDPGKTLTKSGSGNLTIQGVGTTLAGTVSISGGAITITDFRSLTNNTAAISLGNATTAGNLIIGTSTTPTAGGLTTSRPIVMNGTSASPSIYANQTGVNPVILNGAISIPINTRVKTLILGGTSDADNVINTAIVDPAAGTATGVAANAANAATTLTLDSVTGLAVGNSISGTSIPGGTTITAINVSTRVVTLSAALTAAITAGALVTVPNVLNSTQLRKIGSGTWVLAGPNTYTGLTNIVNGTLKLKANAAVSTILGAANAITFGNSNVFAGGTLEFVGQDGINNVQTLGVLTTTSGANTIRLTPGVGGTASLTFASQATGAAGTVNFVGADFTNNTITITGGNGLISRTNYWEGADFAYRESNVLRAPVYGTDAGFVNAAAGAATLTASANNQIQGDITAQTVVTVSTLKFDGAHTLNLAGNLTLSTGGVLATGGASAITGASTLVLGANAFVVRTNLEGDSLTLSTLMTGTAGLTKSGAGTLIITSAISQTGTVTINEGTVQLSGSGRLGAAAALTMRQLTVLDLNGVTPSTNTNAFNNNGSVTSATAATFTVGGSNGTGTSFGTVNGAISLTKLGTGGQSWLGNSTYTGVTTIGSTGLVTVDTLANIGQNSGIGRGDATSDATNAASLVFNGSTGGLVYAGVIRDNNLTLGSRSATTDRLFTLSGSGATLSSTATLNNAIVWSNTGAIVHGTDANRTLTLTGTSTGDNTFNPQLTNSTEFVTSLTKTAAGQWNLGNEDNTYTGLTTVGNGILALNDNGALPAGSPVVLGTTTTNGILQMSGTFARNLTTTPTAGTGTVSWGGTTGGGGFAAHTTPLAVTLNGGAGLTWGSGGFVGTGGTQSLIFNSTSALADVTFTNAIDLGAANRTITVNDNVNTGADFATLTGILSGAGGGLLKNGNGILRLTGANSYTGTTGVSAGTLVVSSLGSSTGGGTSSVGAGGVAMDNSNAINLGAGGNNAGSLQYVGAGETSDRKIRFNSTTGTSSTNQIHADGSGPLILTNVANDMTAGAKSVVLRGSNTAGNMITSVLADNGGALTITVDGGATWILTNSSNNYTGNTNANAGALGIGHDTAIGAALTISNGNVFAYGGDRTLANTLNLGNNATSGFIGDYSLTFNGTNNLAAGANNVTLSNSIVAGKALTFNGLLANSLTATRTWTMGGNGETIINGNFTTSTAFGVNITYSGNGILNLGTNGATSNWNQAGNALDLDRGTLKFTANEAIPNASAANGGLTISPELETADTATVDLNGTTQTVNALTATSNGTLSIDNTSATAATFRFGANNAAINFGGTTNGTVPGLGSYTITDSGAGALSIVKLGNTSTTFGSHVVLTHQGTTAAEGGSLTINANLAGSTGLSASGGSTLQLNGGWTTASGSLSLSATGASTLALTGGITSPNLITSVEVGGGSTLSLLDGTGSAISNLTTLNLGNTGAGTVTLNLNVGDLNTTTDRLNTDTLTLLTGNSANLGNTITFNLTDAGLNANQTYTLLNLVDGGITAFGVGNMLQGATPGGFDSFTWNVTNNLVQLTTGNLLLNDLYWRGSTDNTWNANVNNWSTDKAGANPAVSIPGQGNEVIFAWDNPGAGPLVTTLEQNFKINSLVFEAGATTTPSSVEINPGALATARLEIAPQAATDGITLSTGGPAAVTIGANLRLGADQTWTTASGTLLTIGGALFGEADVTKAGDGRVVLSAAADPTFNAGQTATFTVDAGTLEMTNLTALGSLANSNVVPVTINSGGAFYYNNATATTALAPIANAITLGGGTLSLGGANHFIGPVLTVNAASTINLRDSNSATLTTTARALTLNNGLTGTGDLTVDSLDDGTAINQLLGTLTLNQDNSAWSGDLTLLRGSITTNNANGLGSGDNITIERGRITLAAGAGTPTIAQAITIARAGGAAIGEFSLGNGVATTFSGVLTLGGAGGTGELRVFGGNDAATATFTGGVVLANNGLIGMRDAANRLLHIDSVISETGGARTLRINDGVWGGTAGTVRLTGANTFTGNVTVARGILEFDTVTNAGGAASSLGQGNAISIASVANSTLRFVGDGAANSQTTDRAISITPETATNRVGTLDARGTDGASITYAGPITVTPNADGSWLVLSGLTGSAGFITGGITQTGTTADVNVNGGTWTLSGTQSTVADDLFVQGVGTVLNLDTTGVVRLMSGATTSDLNLRNGAVVNINAANAVQYTGTPYRLFVGQGADGADVTLNLNADLQSGRVILGERGVTRVGIINGPGTLTVDNAAADFMQLYRGEINANIASSGVGAGIFRKLGSGTVTLRGDNSGLTNTGINLIDEGTLVLDYTLNNASKLNSARQLDMRGSTLQIVGNASAATTQNVLSFTMATGAGNNIIDVTAGTGQDATLSLGVITRAASAGTLRINLNNAGAAVTTSTLNTNGIVGLAGYTTVKDSTGTWFGTNSTNLVGGSIVALASTLENDISAWTNAAHISDETTGFTGTVSANHLNSLRFNAAGGSALNFAPGGVLTIASGGILVTDQVTSGSPGLFGGTLGTGVTEIIVTQDSSQTFEISSRIGVNNAFTKSGPGTVLLSGTSASTGAVSVQNGILQLAGGNAIGDTSIVTLASNRNSTLQLLASETIGRLQGGQRATNSDYGTVAVGSHTLTLNQAGGNTTYAGVFTGSGGIVMSAASVSNLTLTGISTGFTGTVEVNGGLFQLVTSGRIDASSITINGNGMMLIDNNGTTSITTRILDTTPIILNSAAGGGTNIRGLWVRNTDANASRFETIGNLVFNSGASYLTGDANHGTGNGRAGIIASNFVRNDNATVSVRGRNLGTTTTHHNQFRIGTAANQTAFIAGLIGGAGAAATPTISIVPWAIGETHNATATASANMGNSLVTYVSGAGFRPLDFTDEYGLYATAGDTNNTRESITADLTGLAGRTLNALVVHNQSAAASALNVTGAGAGNGLVNTSGTFLFTLNPAAAASSAHSLTLGGFDDGISVGGSEYLFFVQNPSAAANTPVLTTTIGSQLITPADITKSGRGTLILNQVNTAGGGANKTTLNEGILEIADLDNIGGGTGALVFAGGTLRLGTGFADDISTRTISFLTGGGALDTNGIDLALANSLGSGVGGFTKTGAGNLTLNASATYTGNSVLALGTVTVGANNALGNGGNLTLAAGTTLALGTSSLTHGLVTTSGASPLITGTGTISASTGFAFNHTGNTQIDAVLAGSGGLLKTQTNVLTLTGASTYTGTTEVRSGTLSFNSIGNVGGGASALGTPGNVEDGIIRMGLTTTATSLTYTGSGHSSDRLIGMQGTTGGLSLFSNGTGAVGYGGARFETPGNKTLTLRGTSDPTLINTIGALVEVGGVLTLNKTDANTWQVNQASSYTGVTQIDNGTLQIGVDDALPTGTTVRIGTGATAGTLDLNGFDQTIGSLLVQTNNNAVTNNLIVDTDKTLTINGAVTIGVNANESDTNFNASGGGAVVVNSGGANFQVGGATGNTNENRVDVDFSGLGSFTANLGAGTFRLGDAATGTGNMTSTFKLATDNTITAATIRIGDGTGGGQVHTLTLGSGTNVLNANTINVGSAGATIRSSGAMVFDPGDTTGSVTIRASDGSSRAAINMVNTTGNTATDISSTIDLSGHTADILASTLTMASRTQAANAATATFSFDQGTLDVTTLNMASRTGAGTGNATATVNLGDSAAPGTPTVTIGALNMAVNTSGGGSVIADLNVTGGNVNIGTGSGTAINMANAAASRTVTSNINLTGGTVDVTGNIIRQGGAGIENATVTLNGSTLDMNGNSIGSSASPIVLAAQSGTLENLAELNGGGVLTKTTAGILIMQGTNTYTGGTAINGGTLQVNSAGAIGTTGTVSFGGGVLQYTANNTTDYSARFSTADNQAFNVDTNGQNVTYATALQSTDGTLTKQGTGTLELTGASTYTGGTTVSAGTLLANNTTGSATGSGSVLVATGATLGGSGLVTPGANNSVTIDSGATLTVGNVADSVGSDLMITTSGTGELVINGKVEFDIWSGAGAGDNTLLPLTADRLIIGGGEVVLAGILAVNNPNSIATWAAGDMWRLFDWALATNLSGTFTNITSSVGNFNDLPDLSLIDPLLAWDASNLYSQGTLSVVVIPEPSRVLLLLLGGLGLLMRRRRK